MAVKTSDASANKVRIMQTGDILLGGAYRSLPEDLASVCRSALLFGFVNSVSEEIKTGVSVVLISGNLFDSSSPDPETVDAVIRLFSENPDVDFFITPGERDFDCPLWESGLLPDNVTVFLSSSVRRVVLQKKRLEIYGFGVKKKAKSNQPLADRKVHPSTLPKIVTGHCELNNPISSYFSVTEEEMKGFGADFYAFSHESRPYSITRKDGYSYAYTGFFDGRGFDQTGSGGYILITVEEGRHPSESAKTINGIKSIHRISAMNTMNTAITSNTEKVESDENTANTATTPNTVNTITAKRRETKIHRYESITVNAQGAKTTLDAETQILDALRTKKFDMRTSVRAVITGAVSPEVTITKRPAYIHPSLFSLECVNETTPTFDCDNLKEDKSILGEVFRKFYPDMNSKSRSKRIDAARAFRAAYMALTGKDINNA